MKKFLQRYVFSTDHKVIGIQYLLSGLAFLVFGGILALLIRWQLAYPWAKVPLLGAEILPDRYVSLFTMHGSIMVFFAMTPILIGGFGNYVLPLQVGARDMCFPRLNMLSYWVFFVACVVLVASYFVEGGPAGSGWTAYPPLSASAETAPGWGQSMWILAIALVGTSSIMGAINYIATTLQLRAPGMDLLRLPLTTWGLFYTAILNLLWVPVVAAALFMLLLDRVAGTSFFIAGPLAPHANGQPLLYQHLFWGFGHPEVYILILPVWGIVGDLLAVFARKPAFGYRATVFSMGAITFLSGIVWGHHMFTSGMNPLLGKAFVFLTLAVSIPSAIFFLNWFGTLWRGAIRFTPPMVASMMVIFVFGLGGLTGIFNAIQVLDVYLHETYFIVGHFHFTLAASLFFGAFAGIYYWFPKMFGREMNRPLAQIHLAISFVAINALFGQMMIAGIGGMLRRTADPSVYAYTEHLGKINVGITHSAFVLAAAQVFFLANFAWSLFAGRRASDNPWEATTLEWATTSPPPHENFEKIPRVVARPHEYGAPGAGPSGVVPQWREDA